MSAGDFSFLLRAWANYKSWPELQDDLTLLFFSPGTWGGLPKYIYGAMGKCILLFAKSWQKYQNHLLHDHSQPLVLHTVRTNLFFNKHHQFIDAHGLFRHLQQSHKATPKPFSRYVRRQLARSPNIKAREFLYFFILLVISPFSQPWRGGCLRSWPLIYLRFRLGPNPPGAT